MEFFSALIEQIQHEPPKPYIGIFLIREELFKKHRLVRCIFFTTSHEKRRGAFVLGAFQAFGKGKKQFLVMQAELAVSPVKIRDVGILPSGG